jgi:hypothetical protein
MREPKELVVAMEAGVSPASGSVSRSLSSTRVSFVRALYDLFYISLVRFKPKPRAFAWNLVAANTAGLLFLPRVEPVVLWISIVTGLVFMARWYQKMGFVRLLGAGHALWVFVVPWLAFRWANLPPGASGWFEAWLGWVIVTDTISLVLDARDSMAFLAGDRAKYY